MKKIIMIFGFILLVSLVIVSSDSATTFEGLFAWGNKTTTATFSQNWTSAGLSGATLVSTSLPGTALRYGWSDYSRISELGIWVIHDGASDINIYVINTTNGTVLAQTEVTTNSITNEYRAQVRYWNMSENAIVVFESDAETDAKFHMVQVNGTSIGNDRLIDFPANLKDENAKASDFVMKQRPGYDEMAIAFTGALPHNGSLSLIIYSENGTIVKNFTTGLELNYQRVSSRRHDIAWVTGGEYLMMITKNMTAVGGTEGAEMVYIYNRTSNSVKYFYDTWDDGTATSGTRGVAACPIRTMTDAVAVIIHGYDGNNPVNGRVIYLNGTAESGPTEDTSIEYQGWGMPNSVNCFSEPSADGDIIFTFIEDNELRLSYMSYDPDTRTWSNTSFANARRSANFAADDIEDHQIIPCPEGDCFMVTALDNDYAVHSGIFWNGSEFDNTSVRKVSTAELNGGFKSNSAFFFVGNLSAGSSSPDATAPVITGLTNESTTNISSQIIATIDENANSSYWLYNSTVKTAANLVHIVSNNTFVQNFNQNFTNLLNSTTYYLNVSACDIGGNCARNDTFSFKTAANTATAPPAISSKLDLRLACEKSMTCCASTVYDTDTLCWINITWDDCTGGLYCPEAHWNFDKGALDYDELAQHHNYAAEFDMANPDDMDNAIFGRPRFRSYGSAVIAGFTSAGGNHRDQYCNSWKCMMSHQTFSDGQYTYIEQGMTWNHSYIGWTSAQCIDGDGCDANATQNIDGMTFKWFHVPTNGDIAEFDEDRFGCSDCLILQMNKTLNATAYDRKTNYTFYLAVNPRPTYYNTSQIGNTVLLKYYYAAAQNEKINVTYGVFREPYADDLADWMGNVTNHIDKESIIRNWTLNSYQAFNYPSGYSNYNKTDYYNGLLSYFYNTRMCVNESDPTNLYQVGGHCAVVNTPNKAQYEAIWKWDSYNTGLGIISAINASHRYAPYILGMTVNDWLKVWINNSFPYPTVKPWNRTIHQFNVSKATQPLGGWAILALNMYNLSQDNGMNLMSKDYLCNVVVHHLRSDYQHFNSTDVDKDYLIGIGSGELGRDGADIIDTGTNENADSTEWYALHSLTLANMYDICGNASDRTSMLQDFNKTVNALDAMWNESCNDNKGCYWNFDELGNFYDFDPTTTDDWAMSPFAGCLPLVFGNISRARAEYLIEDLLRNNFTDAIGGYPYTSIPYSHPSYTTTGGSGNTWEGPIWAGVDNFWCLNAIRDAQSRHGLTNLADDEVWLESQNLEIMGLNTSPDVNYKGLTPWGAESWGPQNLTVRESGLWASNPYGWGGNVPTSAINDYNIFSVLKFTLNISNVTILDSSPPTITIVNPENAGKIAGVKWTWINISTDEDANCSYNLTDATYANMTPFTTTDGLVHSFNFSNSSSLNNGTTYTLYYKCQDAIGNSNPTSTVHTFTLKNPSLPVNWTQRFNWINTNRSNSMGVFNRGTLTESLYTEVPNPIRAYINMYKITNDPMYLNLSAKHLDNLSKRYYEWGTMTNGDFRYGHIGGIYAEYIYEANRSGISSYMEKGSDYLRFINANVSPRIDRVYRSFTYDSVEVGCLLTKNASITPNTVKPFNQQYGYHVMQMYLCNITTNETYCNRSTYLTRCVNTSTSRYQCPYDNSKRCINQSYRFNFGQAWEDYTGITFGFPPTKEVWNYWSQDAYAWYRMWKHGLIDNTTITEVGNSIYYAQYVQEGNLTNVLMSDNVGVAAGSFSDFNDLYLTHGTYTIPYFSFIVGNITNISEKIINHTYDFIDDGDGTYSFYIEPYGSVIDPRDGTSSSYSVSDYSNVTFDIVLMYISTYLYATNDLSRQQEPFNFTLFATEAVVVTPPAGGGGGGGSVTECYIDTDCTIDMICKDNFCIPSANQTIASILAENISITDKIGKIASSLKSSFGKKFTALVVNRLNKFIDLFFGGNVLYFFATLTVTSIVLFQGGKFVIRKIKKRKK